VSALLEVEELTVSRGGRVVVDGVSLAASRGDLVAVVGPNGAGKSSLFAALLGLIPSTGRVATAGRLAYVPQHETSVLHFPVTALDVALMGAYGRVPLHRRLGGRERRAALDALARVGLEGEARRSFGELSGGQRQRVLLARALVQQGTVLLLDEPLSGVDAPSEDAIVEALARERADGRAVLIATHDLAFARSACTHALLLNRRSFGFGASADALTADTLRAAYGARLIVLDEQHDAIDEGSHHDHTAG
jgi:manganese/iron transport system ATP-binding protein/manganese/zinc/iron transport system ATP- binding protein